MPAATSRRARSSRPVLVAFTTMTAASLLLPAGAEAAPQTPEGDKQNVIMIIGDGMGYNSVDLGSLYQYGESRYQSQDYNHFLATDGRRSAASQVYQEFPTQVGMETGYLFSRDYSTIDAWASPRHVTRANPDQRLLVTDSGAAATAMSTGVRTRGGYLGWDRNRNVLVDMVDIASEAGMATGVVTSARFWSDTPAGFAVHADDGDTADIIDQLLYHEDLDVVMGGGHPEFDSDGQPKAPFHGFVPEAEWAALNGGPAVEGFPDWTLVEDRRAFRRLGTPSSLRGREPGSKVFGLAQTDGALFHDRPGSRDVPFEAPMANNVVRLDEMATATLNILDRSSEEGFFTMIEAATIDSAAHNAQLGRQIEEQIAFNQTVEATVRWVERNSSWEETTLIVTSDHETGNLWGAGTIETGDFQPLTGRRHQVPAAEYTDFTDLDPARPNRPPHYHTHQLVPVYAKGPLAADLADVTTGEDPVHGDYLYNVDIATVIHAHLRD